MEGGAASITQIQPFSDDEVCLSECLQLMERKNPDSTPLPKASLLVTCPADFS